MVGAAWPLALFAVVFSQFKKELAKNVCRPDTQNVAGHKEFIRGMGQAIGGWCMGSPKEVQMGTICN